MELDAAYRPQLSKKKNRTNDVRRDYAISADYRDIRQFFISRRKERDSRRNVALT
jgi:hypothetical protein